MTKRSKSSNRWLTRQRRDPFAKRAVAEAQVSRAHFKLQQLDEKYRLLKPGLRVLELGAAPGGWTRYLEQRLGHAGLLIACDPRPISASGDTVVIERAYGDPETDAALTELLGQRRLDLVLSDMAPNLSGNRATDQARCMHLADLAAEAALTWLNPGGDLVVKLFQGEGVDAWTAQMRGSFRRVQLSKPKASRPESREVYALARDFLGSKPELDSGPESDPAPERSGPDLP